MHPDNPEASNDACCVFIIVKPEIVTFAEVIDNNEFILEPVIVQGLEVDPIMRMDLFTVTGAAIEIEPETIIVSPSEHCDTIVDKASLGLHDLTVEVKISPLLATMGVDGLSSWPVVITS
jgi:hypothetical protein